MPSTINYIIHITRIWFTYPSCFSFFGCWIFSLQLFKCLKISLVRFRDIIYPFTVFLLLLYHIHQLPTDE